MTCPKCGFPDWKSLRLIHEEGTVLTNSSTGGVVGGVGSGGLAVGVGGASSSGHASTRMAADAAPPKDESFDTGCAFAALIILVGVSVGFGGWTIVGPFAVLGAVALVILGIVVGTKVSDELTKEHKKKMEEWNTSAKCLRCGGVFKIPERGNVMGPNAPVNPTEPA